VLFELGNQSLNLAYTDSVAFSTDGELTISYSCQFASRGGWYTQFNLLNVDNDRLDLAWKERVTCPYNGTDTISLPSGMYKATVFCNGDVDWSMKVTQTG
jgi:hypothetical protein